MSDEGLTAQAETGPATDDPAKPTVAATPPNVPAPPEGADVHVIERPLGEEFPLTDHESIAAKLVAKVEEVFYHLETDVEAGVHRLIGWMKPSA